MANQLDKEKILEVNVLKVSGNSLIFDNTIYQISNITSVQLSSSSERYENPLPSWIKVSFTVGVLFVVTAFIIKDSYDNNIALILGVLSVAFFLLSYFGYTSHKPYLEHYEHGLNIMLTSGQNPVFISDNEDFIKQIVMSLYQVISDDEHRDKTITYNFTDNKISYENHLKINSVHGSNVVSGSVKGDVVNNI